MLIYIGGDICLFTKDIVGIFDFDDFTSSEDNREFFREIKKYRKKYKNADKTRVPQSVILTVDELGREKYYLSPINVESLKKGGEDLKDAGFKFKT